MGKDQYATDLYMASDDDLLDGVFIVGDGEAEGEFLFRYFPLSGEEPMTISAQIVGLEHYPSAHECFVFSTGDVSSSLGEMLGDLPDLSGMTVRQIMNKVSLHLRNKEADGSASRPFIINDDNDGSGDITMADLVTPAMMDLISPPTVRPGTPMMLDEQEDIYSTSKLAINKGKGPAKPPSPKFPTNRLASDLRAVKDAGFRLGYHGNLKGTSTCYVIITSRLSKLGISDNALDAWKVEQKRYISLIIEYPNGYVSLSDLLDNKKSFRKPKSTNIRMRIRQGDKYKPKLKECQAAFKNGNSGKDMPYIFQTLELFLNERLVNLVKKRVDLGFSWYGAEEYYFTEKEMIGKSTEAMEAKYWHDDNSSVLFSRLVTGDHFGVASGLDTCSFPLVAMQFFLRHFARYTDFCLVCHRTVKSDLEALEPYVCSTPTCLSKYLSSDFGPGIERDIVEQPYVVDLLVSFCYAASRHQKLKSFPDALNLKVPFPQNTGNAGYQGTFDPSNNELTLRIAATTPISHPVQVGTWMSISGSTPGEVLTCRAADMSQFPIIRVSDPISTTAQANALNIGSAYTIPNRQAGAKNVSVQLFNQDFAAFTPVQKQDTICMLLDTLPTVREMKDRLREGHLSSWGDRISPAALGVLRWIVASNRACIVQVDGLESGTHGGVFPATHTEDRVYGMGNWMQFRFAMGAPDKEQKFQNAASSKSRSKYPTLFAWHGSPLVNWHAIIREGLNFEQTLNGRAYGNGVYHSLDFRTSLGYTSSRFAAAVLSDKWSKSVLKVSAAVALNEIVNSPGEFVSRSPHLVVDKVDWINTRYLFVQCAFSNQSGTASQKQPSLVKLQDPSMTPNGEQGKLVIPKPKPTRARKEDQLAAEKKKDQNDSDFYTVVIDGIEERIPKIDELPSDATNDSDLDVFIDKNGDSYDIDDMDVAIAMSIEESHYDIYMPPVTRKRKSGFFSYFSKAETNRAENVPPVGSSTAISSTVALVPSTKSVQPPSYDDLPTVTPPGYTEISGTNGFFTNTESTATAFSGNSSPGYTLASGSSTTATVNQSTHTRTVSGSNAATPRSFLFGGFRKPTTSFGNVPNQAISGNAFSTLPLSNTTSLFASGNPAPVIADKGKGKATVTPARPAIFAPAVNTTPVPVVSNLVAPTPAVVTVSTPSASTRSKTAARDNASSAQSSVPVAPEPPKVPMTDFVAGALDVTSLPLIAQPTFATHAATKRLQKEYKNLLKIQDSTPLHELGWYTNPDHFENVYQWIVELHSFDSTLPLAQDMKARGVKSIVLELRFGASYPSTPPFVRVIKPKFLPFMNGGGGHVTIGGAVCLEMLTGTGWNSKTTIESILLNVRLAMMSTDPKPARLDGVATSTMISSYGVHEAVEAYLRACRTHGWQVPKGFEQMARPTT